MLGRVDEVNPATARNVGGSCIMHTVRRTEMLIARGVYFSNPQVETISTLHTVSGNEECKDGSG